MVFGYVRREKVITTFLLVSSIFSIFGRSFITLLPVFAKEILRVGASGLGFLASAPGLGTIIGALSLAASARVEARRGILVTILLAFSVSLFAFAATSDFQIAFVCLVLVGALSTVFETLLNTAIQLRVVESYRGRVMGFYGLTGGGLRELGGMQAGFLAEWSSAPFAIEAGAVILALIGFFFLGSRLRGHESS
jgi:MFS family permease